MFKRNIDLSRDSVVNINWIYVERDNIMTNLWN